MAGTDKLSDGLETVAKQVQKVFEQGKARVEQLQLERQMDSTARRLGYMDLDESRGRAVDQAKKDELLAELGRMEDELHSTFGAEAGRQGDEATEETPAAQAPPAEEAAEARPGSMGSDMKEAQRIAQAAADAGVQPAVARRPFGRRSSRRRDSTEAQRAGPRRAAEG